MEISILKKAIPVCFLNDGNLLLYKSGVFYSYNTSDGSKERVCKFSAVKETLFSKIGYVARILRLGVRAGILIESDLVLVVIEKSILEINLKLKTISKGYTTPSDSRPLKISAIEGVDGFDDMVVYGEYLHNPSKNPVSIYKRRATDDWEISFTFKQGEIEHIHNIIADKYNQCVWIMTGDFDQSAAIWIAKDNFKTVYPVLRGHQDYRGCVGFPTVNGLLYATDSPYCENSIRILSLNSLQKWESKKLIDINGSSIYGTRIKDKFIFSTAVEGDGRKTNIFTVLFGRKRGVAIKDNYCYVYAGNEEDGFLPVYKAKKDFLPFILFQFGTLKFPEGKNESNILPIYHIATIKYDLSVLLFNIETVEDKNFQKSLQINEYRKSEMEIN